MANYPVPGNSENVWGTDLVNFTTVSFEPSGADGGKLKTTALDGRNFTGTISFSGATVTLPVSTSIGTISATEISYLDNASSNIQTQISTHTSATSAHGTATAIVGINDSQVLTNKTISGASNTLSNLIHGTQVDNPSSGVHGATGSIVGTTDTQALTNKTLTLPKINSTTTVTVSGEEINYIAGTISNVQTQLNNKATSTHTHTLSGGATDVTATYAEVNQALDGIGATVTANTLTELTSGGYDASNLHIHDSRYYTETELSSGAISTVVTTALDANKIVVSNNDGKLAAHTNTYATSTNLTTLVAGSASNADSLHTHATTTATAAISGAFGVAYQISASDIAFVTISVRCITTAASGSAYIVVKSDSSATPTTIIATSGIESEPVSDLAGTFTTTFIVAKGDYYRVDKTESNGTVTIVNWIEKIIKIG